MKYCLSPQDFPRAPAIFYRTPLLLDAVLSMRFITVILILQLPWNTLKFNIVILKGGTANEILTNKIQISKKPESLTKNNLVPISAKLVPF